MDIAVQYKKIGIDDEKCFFIPTNLMFGYYDKNAQLFFSETGMVCYPINSKDTLAYEYFSSPTTIKELRNSLGRDLSNEDLLSTYFYKVRDNCYVGFYNEDDITVLSLDVYGMEEEILSAGKCNYANLFYFDGKRNKKKNTSNAKNQAVNTNEKDELKSQIKEISDSLDSIDKNYNEKSSLKWSVMTPFKTLGIAEKEYTKQELLKILSDRIKSEQSKRINHKQKVKRIDSLLDAYNEIKKDLR